MTKKEKKTRDTSFSKTYKVIDKHGLDKINAIWTENGIYRSSEILGTTPWVIRYIANKHKWRRPAEKCPAIVAGVLAGNASAEYYKTLDFSGINLKQNKEQ